MVAPIIEIARSYYDRISIFIDYMFFLGKGRRTSDHQSCFRQTIRRDPGPPQVYTQAQYCNIASCLYP